MPEIHLDLLNLNSVLLILLIILIGGYLYYEIYKLKSIINDLQYTLNKQQVYPHNGDNGDNGDNGVNEQMTPDVSSIDQLGQTEIHQPIPLVNMNDLGLGTDDNKYVSDSELIRNQMEYSQDENDILPDEVLTENTIPTDNSIQTESDNSIPTDNSILTESDNSIPTESESPFSGDFNAVNIDDILLGKNIITDNTLSDILDVSDDLTKVNEFINTMKLSDENKNLDYNSMTVSQLKKILSDEGIPVSGNKTKLIERIKENKL